MSNTINYDVIEFTANLIHFRLLFQLEAVTEEEEGGRGEEVFLLVSLFVPLADLIELIEPIG